MERRRYHAYLLLPIAQTFCSDFSKLSQLAPIAVSAVALPESSKTMFGIDKDALLTTPDVGKDEILELVEGSLKQRCAEMDQFASNSSPCDYSKLLS